MIEGVRVRAGARTASPITVRDRAPFALRRVTTEAEPAQWRQIGRPQGAVSGALQLAPEPPADSQRADGIRPVLIETLLDAARLPATGVPAVNCIALGITSGRAAFDRHQRRPTQEPKHRWAYLLVPKAPADLHGERPWASPPSA